MISIKIECTNTNCETLAKHLDKHKSYNLWVYEDKIYAMFKVRSLTELNKLTRKFTRKGIQFRYLRIQKKSSWTIW